MKSIIFVFAVTLGLGSLGSLHFGHFGNESYAHEGHDKTPGAIEALEGGVVQGTSQLYLELVGGASGIKLFARTHDQAKVLPSELKLLGTAQAPKKKKVPVKFTEVDDHYEAKVDAKGAYRYTLELTTTYKGKKEKVTFQVEPQG